MPTLPRKWQSIVRLERVARSLDSRFRGNDKNAFALHGDAALPGAMV